MLIDRLRTIAKEVGLNADDFEDFKEFCRAVSARRAARDSQKIALAVVSRRKAAAA